MRIPNTALCLSAAASLLIVSTSAAQPSGDMLRNTLRVQGGYGLTLGGWTQHRYSGVTQFGGGAGVRAEVEHRPWRGVGIAVGGGYLKLTTSKWESYARSRGDVVNASAYLLHIDLLLKPYLSNMLPNVLSLAVGITVANKQGRESFGRFSYDYDFLKGWAVGCAAAIEYDKYFTDKWALAVRVGGMFVFSGLSYADGEKRVVAALPVTAGFAYMF